MYGGEASISHGPVECKVNPLIDPPTKNPRQLMQGMRERSEINRPKLRIR